MKNFVRVLAVFLALTFPVVGFADKNHDDDHDDYKKQDHKEKKLKKDYLRYDQQNFDNSSGKSPKDISTKTYKQDINQNENNSSFISPNDRKLAIRKFFGVVQKMSKVYPSIWTIDNQAVVVTRDTFISEKYGKVKIGIKISGEGSYSGNNLVAISIEAQNNGQGPVNPAGRIDKIPAGGIGTWIIDDREVYVSESTIIKQLNGKAEIGAFVNIKGDYAGKVYKAKEIEVRK